jgi:hypothetical protein
MQILAEANDKKEQPEIDTFYKHNYPEEYQYQQKYGI